MQKTLISLLLLLPTTFPAITAELGKTQTQSGHFGSVTIPGIGTIPVAAINAFVSGVETALKC